MKFDENSLGTDGFEFVEYTAVSPEQISSLKELFTQMGFAEIAKHRSKEAWLYRQGEIQFIVNADPRSQARQFAAIHGPSVCGMAFRVRDAATAFDYACNHGASAYKSEIGPMELNIPAILGVGGSVIYFVDRYGEHSIYDVDFVFYPDYRERLATVNTGLLCVDHLTHNVMRGHMDEWAEFYERIGNFREVRHFDIEGKYTGLLSRAMTSPCGKIRIPINESRDDQSQVEEFIRQYNGEGIQHIALSTNNIYQSVQTLRKLGMRFMVTPDTYYEQIDKRVSTHQEDVEQLKALNILIDGDSETDGILLQIFTETVIGPVFFEIIQRKGNSGFGEGNFRALFESIEEDQVRRGVIDNA
ncbi:4-hydroxyphenylpyruvate dioxygenase [Vibrio tritonius]|uniref:4-hydroxyphenylpyruvate dioxygenase n=1 Tax=Vibrio tritonius TaxID=1435069 RepID=UPI00315CE4A4